MQYGAALPHVVALLSDSEGLSRMLRAGLREALFVGAVDPIERRIFSFARDWHLRDGTAPPRRALEEEFPQYFAVAEVPEDTDMQPEFLVKVLQNNAVRVGVQDFLRDAASRIFAEDVDQVEELAKAQRQLSDLYLGVSGRQHVRSLDEYAPDYVAAVLARAEDSVAYQEGLVRFPYPQMSELWKGMKPRQSIVYFAYTGNMKSLTVELMTLRNALEGKRVYHCTFENGLETTTNRLAAFATAELLDRGGPEERWEGGISLAHLESGALTPNERDRLRAAQESLRGLPIYLDESPAPDERSVEAIFAKARDFGAELVVIDQSSWVASPDPKLRSTWEIEAAKVRRIQEWTNRLGVVTALAAQANREAAKSKSGTKLEHVALSDEVTKGASFAVTLRNDSRSYSLRVDLVKARGLQAGMTFTMHYDLETQTRLRPDQPLEFL